MSVTFQDPLIDVVENCDLVVCVKGDEVLALRPIGAGLIESATNRSLVEMTLKPLPYISTLELSIDAPPFEEDPDA